MDKQKEFDIRTYSDGFIQVFIGGFYSAMGTCGITEGVEVKGKLTKIDEWGAYLTCESGITHLCNKRTLNTL